MPYEVRGLQDDKAVSQTRLYAGSAIVLAKRWQSEGVKDVRIVAKDGMELSPASFMSRRAESSRFG